MSLALVPIGKVVGEQVLPAVIRQSWPLARGFVEQAQFGIYDPGRLHLGSSR